MTSHRRGRSFVIAVAVVLLGVACSSDGSEGSSDTTAPAETTTTAPAETTTSVTADGAAEPDGDGPELAFAEEPSPVRVEAGFSPVAFPAADGRIHLSYELYLTNRSDAPVEVKKVAVVDADEPSEVIVSLEGEELAGDMTQDLDTSAEGTTIEGGQVAVLYVDTSVADAAEVPAALRHVVSTVDPESDEELPTVEGALTPVQDIEVPALAQPVGDGTWVAAEGCCDRSHHRRGPFTLNGEDFLAQRYAIDFIKYEDGKMWEGDDPKDLDAWFTYGQDALAVAEGTVSSVLDGEDDITPFEPNPKPRNVDNITGNHVIVDMGDGLFVVYAHLQPGSIQVEEGDEVQVGDVLALVGNSGNTDAPHLHIHVMDANNVVQSHGVPFTFVDYELLGTFDDIEALFPEPFGEVGPGEPELLDAPEPIADAYPLELDIVDFAGG